MTRWLDAIADLGLEHPRAVIAVCVVLLGLCGAASATLEIDSSRHSMVSADDPHQALQQDYFDRYGYPNTLVAVISGGEVDGRRQVAAAVERDLLADPAFEDRVLSRIDRDSMAELVLLQPTFERPPGTDDQGHLVSDDGRHHYVLVFPEIPGTQQAAEVQATVERVRHARDVAVAEVPSVRADVTGAAALVVDEQAEIQRGVLVTSGATGAAVLLLLWFGFRNLRYALFALLPVVLGVVGTMAVARGLSGGLNMVTSSCSSILLGLGIDFGVYLLRRYGELRVGSIGLDEAVRQTVRRAGAALAIGAVTTSIAFLTTAGTEFTAYARLGVIVAVGLLFMLVATLVLLPALFVATTKPDATPPRMRRATWLVPLVTRGQAPLAAFGVAALLASLWSMSAVGFDTRFYDFIPTQVESARGLLAIEDDPQATPLRATVPAGTVEEARALAEELRALDVVGSVVGPPDALPPLNEPALRLRLLIPISDEANWGQRAYAAARAIAERGFYEPTDLPPTLQAQFVSRDGSEVALHVTPSGDIWDPEFAERFHDDVSATAPRATGLPMSVHVHLTYIRDGFRRAAGGAALVVLLVVALAFRDVRDAAWTLLPCVTAFVWMLGAMALFDWNFDAASIVALPLILGISIDAGVHLMHRVRESEAEHGTARAGEVIVGTGSAVLLSTATTMAGFAALMLADYGAMQSLGRVMTLGIGCSMIASVVFVPACWSVAGRLHS